MPKSKQPTKPVRLRITQVRSGIGRPAVHRATLRALGLRHHQQTIERPDSPSIRGMLLQVRHLVRVEEVAESEG
jgi:large subunit ribosomal protein L30